ncbi:1-acyl-sn-glycerol-3-phosphate acyltransferase beta-like [Lycorma delicatula]|uniref:1-acyl-sn-glycerol-3-phosphate acyltransferase beta-like n=1 Tax=Lycorma delicatula TaxID=130591 RepID=UPI003F50FD87
MLFLIDDEERNSVKQNGGYNSWFLDVFTLWETHFVIVVYLLTRINAINYHIKYIFTLFMISVCAIGAIPLCLLRPKNPSNYCYTYPYAAFLSKVLGIKWKVRGSEILAVDEAAVLMLNHQSIIDVIALGMIYPTMKKAVLVVRKSVMLCFPFSLLIYLCSAVFIDRSNGKSANETLLKTTDYVKNCKAKLVVFPEGTRNLNDDTLLPFKKGGFRFAISGQIPIIPLIISPYYFINTEKKCFNQGNILIKVLEPISTVGLTIDDIDELVENTQKLMCAEYKRLKDELLEKDSI